MAVRLTDLEKAGGFLEIDAPNTTVAIQKAGSYRVDAGQSGDQDLGVSVASGEARVYSDNAGLRSRAGVVHAFLLAGQMPVNGKRLMLHALTMILTIGRVIAIRRSQTV